MENKTMSLSDKLIIEKDTPFLNNAILVASLLSVTAIIYIRDIGNMTVPSIIITIIAAVAFLLLNMNNSLCFMLYMFTFKGGVSFDEIFICFVILFFMRNFWELRFKASIIIPFAIICIELFDALSSERFSIEIIKYCIQIIAVCAVILNTRANYNYAKIALSYVIGAFIAVLDIFICTVKYFNMFDFTSIPYRMGITEKFHTNGSYIVTLDPNETGMYVLLAITVIILLIRYNLYSKLPLTVMAVAFVYLGLLTLSRGFVLCLLASFAYLVIVEFNKLYKVAIPIILVGIAVYLIFNIGNISILDSLTKRFDTQDVTGGRVELYTAYFGAAISSVPGLLFGHSMYHYESKVGVASVTHNATLEILTGWGILGLILMCLLFLSMYFNAANRLQEHKIHFIALLPSFMMFLYIQSIPFFSAGARWVLLILLFCCTMLPECEKKPSLKPNRRKDNSQRPVCVN